MAFVTDIALGVIQKLAAFWPAALGVIVFAATPLVRPQATSKTMGAVGSICWALAVIGQLILTAADWDVRSRLGIYNAAGFVLGCTIPFAVAGLTTYGFLRSSTSPGFRAGWTCVAGLVAVLPASTIVLIVHCLSGDCL